MKNLLITDTSKWTLDSLTKAVNWNEVGITVIGSCLTAADAYYVLANNTIDIALVDINVTDNDGINLIEYISKQYSDIKVVAMSSGRNSQFIYKTIYPLVNSFILKPIVLDELINTFSTLVKDNFTICPSEKTSEHLQTSIPTKQISAQAKEYVNRNIASKGLNLKTTAEALHIGYHYLSKRFAEQEGLSFIEYITTRRLDIACQLLETTSLHNYEICEQIGLEPKNFHRIFRNKYDMSPQKYRSLHTAK